MKNIFIGTYFEALNIKNLFENNKIDVFLLNETMSIIEPVIASGGFNSAIIQVRHEDFENATELLQEYEKGNLNLDKKS
jgi:predicted ATP-grasp superfamily ATP-dependent carboligase